jgi:ankyrin repeat protein
MLGRMALFVFMLLSLLPLPARSQDIFDAAKCGNLEKVRALVATDPDLVTAADSDGHTALAWAGIRGQGEVARFLAVPAPTPTPSPTKAGLP